MIELNDDDVAQVAATVARLEGPVFAPLAEAPVFDASANTLTIGPYEITTQRFVSEFWPDARSFYVRHATHGGLGNYLSLKATMCALANDVIMRFLDTPVES